MIFTLRNLAGVLAAVSAAAAAEAPQSGPVNAEALAVPLPPAVSGAAAAAPINHEPVAVVIKTVTVTGPVAKLSVPTPVVPNTPAAVSSVPTTLVSQVIPLTSPATTAAPTAAAGAANSAEGSGPEAGPGGMTIDIVNKWSSDLYVSYGSNAGGPSPVGNPTAGPLGTSTRVVVPTGWAGRVYVGPGPSVNPMGTKVEGSTTGEPDIDVSYVDGYSVPMTCAVEGETIAGCNIDLYENARLFGLIDRFPELGCPGKQEGTVCYNPSNTVIGNGPAPEFFAPCVGSAYTFPNDNAANVGNLKSNHVVCCVGTDCAAPARQGHMPNAPSKRGLQHRDLISAVRSPDDVAVLPRNASNNLRSTSNLHRHRHSNMHKRLAHAHS